MAQYDAVKATQCSPPRSFARQKKCCEQSSAKVIRKSVAKKFQQKICAKALRTNLSSKYVQERCEQISAQNVCKSVANKFRRRICAKALRTNFGTNYSQNRCEEILAQVIGKKRCEQIWTKNIRKSDVNKSVGNKWEIKIVTKVLRANLGPKYAQNPCEEI